MGSSCGSVALRGGRDVGTWPPCRSSVTEGRGKGGRDEAEKGRSGMSDEDEEGAGGHSPPSFAYDGGNSVPWYSLRCRRRGEDNVGGGRGPRTSRGGPSLATIALTRMGSSCTGGDTGVDIVSSL